MCASGQAPGNRSCCSTAWPPMPTPGMPWRRTWPRPAMRSTPSTSAAMAAATNPRPAMTSTRSPTTWRGCWMRWASPTPSSSASPGAATSCWTSAPAIPDSRPASCFVDGGYLDLQARPEATWETVADQLRPPNLAGTPRAHLKERIWAMHPDWTEAGVEATLANFETLPDGTVRPWLNLERHMRILRALWEQRPGQLYAQVPAPGADCRRRRSEQSSLAGTQAAASGGGRSGIGAGDGPLVPRHRPRHPCASAGGIGTTDAVVGEGRGARGEGRSSARE